MANPAVLHCPHAPVSLVANGGYAAYYSQLGLFDEWMVERARGSTVMKFILLDRITGLAPGRSITAEKSLSLAEEYLADHFPTFPVMPGVLMLESLVQSAAWLMRATTDFAHSVVVLAEARNVTYKSFVAPGRRLQLEVEAVEAGLDEWRLKGSGASDGGEMVRAQLRLRQYNLAARGGNWQPVDAELIKQARTTFRLLGAPELARQ